MGTRKNQASLSPQEKQKFVNALLALKANGTYDRYVQMHVDAMARNTPQGGNAAHRGPAFLPWHREYLRRFELELQNVDPTVTLPYWDWTVDNSSSSSIWSPDFMGGDGNSSNNNRVENGPFARNTGNWPLSIDGPALRRTLGRNSPPFPTPQQVNDCLDVTPYDSSPWNDSSNENTSFRNRLEGWVGPGRIHNRAHQWVGGSMMLGSSPNDPVFFLHHCNVDRLWAIWQFMHPNEGYIPLGGTTTTGHNIDDAMFPWSDTPRSVLSHRSLGYDYDTDPPSTATPPEPPTILTATTISTSQINLGWNPPANNGDSSITGYRIERATGGGAWSTIASVSDSVTSYSDRFLVDNTTYSYRVFASNFVGESGPSNSASATTLTSTTTGGGVCFIATAAYGSELAPPVQFLREFRDDVVLKSRFQKPFEDALNVYYKFSPSIANLMKRNKPFKYAMKYSIVLPFIALARTTAFLVNPFVTRKIKR